MKIDVTESDLAESLWYIYYYSVINIDNDKFKKYLHKFIYYSYILNYSFDICREISNTNMYFENEKWCIRIPDDGLYCYDVNSIFEFMNDNLDEKFKESVNFIKYCKEIL